MSNFSYEKQNAQQELYSKLAETISEIERGAKCADAERFLKDLMSTESSTPNGTICSC